jgi:hypothetical protein
MSYETGLTIEEYNQPGFGMQALHNGLRSSTSSSSSRCAQTHSGARSHIRESVSVVRASIHYHSGHQRAPAALSASWQAEKRVSSQHGVAARVWQLHLCRSATQEQPPQVSCFAIQTTTHSNGLERPPTSLPKHHLSKLSLKCCTLTWRVTVPQSQSH